MTDTHKTGRVTIPTDVDVVPETLELLKRWGADAIWDCDGTDYPEELKSVDAKVYSTYYTTRKDNDWARANPDEVQQCYIMTGFRTASSGPLPIPLMEGISPELMQINDRDDVKRWWEVVDRTTGVPLSPDAWTCDAASGCVTIPAPEEFHDYTVSFLAYLIWDPVHMYNAVTNDWKDVEHQITFDVQQPKTRKYTMERLRKFIAGHPYVDVIRYTTFFHQFTLIFDELKREKYVDWYGYSASVSPYILEWFEKEAGYKFRPEYIIDQGYYNNQYRVPSKEFKDFMAFQRREVAALTKELVDITHELGKEAMMFLGDHWTGTEPYMDEFKSIGLDAVVGSVGNGSTLRLISDIPGVKYTEGRYLQLAGVLGVEKETGFTLNYDKYNWEAHPDHFILADCAGEVDFGEGKKSIYALPGAQVLVQREREVQLAVNEFGSGRAVYISGLPYSFANSRLLHRAVLWSARPSAQVLRQETEDLPFPVESCG